MSSSCDLKGRKIHRFLILFPFQFGEHTKDAKSAHETTKEFTEDVSRLAEQSDRSVGEAIHHKVRFKQIRKLRNVLLQSGNQYGSAKGTAGEGGGEFEKKVFV